MKVKVRDFQKGQDPRALAAYTVGEAAHYLSMPVATLRSWVVGRPYPVKFGRHYFQPVIVLPDRKLRQLSFLNLVEAHVLEAIRREHRIPLEKVRRAISFLRRDFGSNHPLAERKIETDGHDLFVRWLEKLINISRNGQFAIPEILDAHLKRIEWDENGLASRLYPFISRRNLYSPRVIVIDPFISFGRPVLAGTGIPTAVIAERCKAGESIEQLAEDYGRTSDEIVEAIRCELAEAA